MKAQQGGAVLLVVLLVVAAMAALAIAVTGRVTADIRRTVAIGQAAQARWYAVAASEAAIAILRRQFQADPGRTTLAQPWARGPTLFPIDGGSLTLTLSDASNCFNLNALVVAEDGYLRADPANGARLLSLLTALSLPQGVAQAVVAQATDWIDPDANAQPLGAEDYDYAVRTPPFRTAATLLADASELLVLPVVDAPLYRLLAPLVCARPAARFGPLNVNTLLPDQAALLVALTQGRLTLDAARRVIGDRPAAGYANLDGFWSHPAFAAIEIDAAMRDAVSLRARYMALDAAVYVQDVGSEMRVLIEQSPAGDARVIARRFGVGG